MNRLKFIFTLFATLLIAGAFGFEQTAFAQDALSTVGDSAGLQDTDLRVVVGNLIRVFLGILGVLALILVMYAGFTWMTAGGNAEKVDKAKKILINGVIGLLIIAASYAITSFIVRSVEGAINGASGGSSGIGFSGGLGSGGRSGGGLGGGGSANLIATKFRPEGDVSIRNVQVNVTFSHSLAADSGSALTITKADTGEAVLGTVTQTLNRLTFIPESTCPEPNATRRCFDENTTYAVAVAGTLKSTSGLTIDCALAPCTSLFTTGTLVDTSDPLVNITLPDAGERFVQGVMVPIQIIATDDAEVSVADFYIADALFNSIPAVGTDLTRVNLETEWDSRTGEANAFYRLNVTVTDIAGNTDSDSVQIRLTPAHCANGNIDSDLGETGIDCGGDCGICTGNVCTEDSQCAEGACLTGVCVSPPVIDSMTPPSGAPGTYVTLSGRRFGATGGTVSFLQLGGGTVNAEIPLCAERWGQTEVTIAVPENALTGPITLTANNGLADTTTNDVGPTLGFFEVNTQLRPNLCRLSPSSGRAGSAVSVIGANFGTSQGTSSITFGNEPVRTVSFWSEGTVNGLVPPITQGEYDVQLTVAGVSSNRLRYNALATTPAGDGSGGSGDSSTNTPILATLTPNIGGVGQYVSLQGSGFGSQTGTVRFESQSSGYVAVGSIDFPAACSESFWNNTNVTVIVPETYTNGQPLENSPHNVILVRQNGAQTDALTFTVNNAPPTPGICSIEPPQGLAGETVVISGANFGSAQGTVSFYDSAPAQVNAWENDSITVTVPSTAQTGPLFVAQSSGDESNSALFAIGEGEGDDLAVIPQGAGYAWVFSTGLIREVPSVVEECSANVVSAVPNARFSENVCVNAQVYAEFTVPMNEATLTQGEGGAVYVEECTTEDCSSATVIPTITQRSSTSEQTSVRVVPAPAHNGGEFIPNTTYRVTITTAALSLEGVPLARNVNWTFRTGSSADICTVTEVLVRPRETKLDARGATTEFNALPKSGACVVLNAEAFGFDWEADNSVASLEAGACTGTGDDYCAKGTALAEGEALITATERASSIGGNGLLVVKFADPFVTSYWPDCSDSCANASVGAKFNIGMSAIVEQEGMVQLLECTNELCTEYARTVSTRARCMPAANGECNEIQFLIPGALNVAKFHRAIISGAVTSESDVTLKRTNYGEDFSWVFQTKQDNSSCGVSRISLLPGTSILTAVGQNQSYRVEAFGSPDSCSVAGQKLEPYSYAWDFEDPITDDANVASFVKLSGTLFDRNVRGGAQGCTDSCIPAGSLALGAVCGNGVIEAGEECEDGNLQNGDGCSSQCLREGADTAGSCGNGIVDRLPNGAGEDCDDGNTQNGDGCSALCLNEGSRVIGSVCGNGDIAYTASQGGEDCDDGNRRNGDGCSALCLNEGSRNATEVAAICGDGVVTEPYESCDDGNAINGDGCSATCIREGSVGIGICGNGVVERLATGAGEDCDDGNAVSGDGCSAACTFEGSSILHATPSICGDGIVGIGEFPSCEAGVSADGRIDPVQLVTVDASATQAVDIEAQRATATVRVSSTEFNVSAEANLALLCVADTAFDCPDALTYGVANNRCCMERPVADMYPKAEGVCRNAAVYAVLDQEMNEASLAQNFYIRMDVTGSGFIECPDSHKVVTAADLANADASWLKRFWQSLRSIVAPDSQAMEIGECIVPIRGFRQEPLSNGSWQVFADYAVAFMPNARYEVVIKGDDINTPEVTGLVAVNGVSFAGDLVQPFQTESGICGIDKVQVLDTNSLSPNVFTNANESHRFIAMAYSVRQGVEQAIAVIPGIYEWAWGDWRIDATNVFTVQDADVTDVLDGVATVQSTETSGQGSVVAQARVTVDAEGGTVNEATGFGKSVSSSSKVRAFICNNPWPSYDMFPFSDTAENAVPGAVEGRGWMNFSLFYCKNNGLPDLTVTAPPTTESPGVLKEYLLKVNDGSGDAIGIRVLANTAYSTPEEWFKAQGFTGSTEALMVDGFEAVRAGRSVYVSAPNVSGASIYPNIYIFSFNEGAEENTRLIFEQLLANISFATNIDSTGLCTDGVLYGAQTCSSDRDCTTTDEYCADAKSKLQRDTVRLSHVRTISNAVEEYGKSNGRCSATTSLICSSSSDCPGAEVCQPAVPVLSAGTFVRSLVASEWSSWNESLGAELGVTLPTDPLPGYQGCAEGSLAEYDGLTCVNNTNGNYVCPAESFVYHYRSIGTRQFELTAELETQNLNFVYPIDTSIAGTIRVGGNQNASVQGFTGGPVMCTDLAFGSEGICGDGILSPGEVCENGQNGPRLACSLTGSTVGTATGTIAQVCNSTCTGFETPTGAVCESFQCGNGIIEASEQCDDGAENGRYGFCGFDCTFASAFSCGDGTIAGGEVCDCRTDWTGKAFGGGTCLSSNGGYSRNPANSCAWNCQGPGSYCGDNVIDSGEQCDGNAETYAGQICRMGSPQLRNLPCESDADCGFSGKCGASDASSIYNACPLANVCIGGAANKLGAVCTSNGDCDSLNEADGACSNIPVQTTRTKVCADNGAGGELCQWQEDNWRNLECRGALTCGNGVVDAGEECDDGNKSNNDACTNECRTNICGDNYVYAGVEVCDNGAQNGNACNASYGSTCNYCSSSCKTITASGSFCGDGIINGGEFCDAGSVPLSYVAADGSIYASCAQNQLGTRITFGSKEYFCQAVGVCNGGIQNGELCTNGSVNLASCGGGSCVLPSCSGTCQSACPFTYASTILQMQTNASGASRSSEVNLGSYEASGAVASTANSATLYFPSCDVATGLRADIDFDFTPPPVYVLFVTDTSGSMGTTPNAWRMPVAKTSVKEAIGTLFSEIDNIRIGLMRFSDTNSWEECQHEGTFCSSRYEAQLKTHVDSYFANGGTNTRDALTNARGQLLSSDVPANARKIIVLLSDGEPNTGQEPTAITQDLKNQGIELYTVALTGSKTLIETMNLWSSGNPNAQNGVDYAYDAKSSADVSEAYTELIRSIIGASFGYVVNGQLVPGTINEGRNVLLPWPAGFSCNNASEFGLPIRVSFEGEGTVSIRNVRLNYCAP